MLPNDTTSMSGAARVDLAATAAYLTRSVPGSTVPPDLRPRWPPRLSSKLPSPTGRTPGPPSALGTSGQRSVGTRPGRATLQLRYHLEERLCSARPLARGLEVISSPNTHGERPSPGRTCATPSCILSSFPSTVSPLQSLTAAPIAQASWHPRCIFFA
jgi:hypothetical protein